MYEGQVVFKPLPYHNDRFKKQDTYLIEVILEDVNKFIHLYYISNGISLNKDGKLEFIDEEAEIKFTEQDNTKINIYDAYTIEHISTDYDVRKFDAIYISISRYIIYANRKTMQVVKAVKRRKFKDKFSYKYQSVVLK